MTIKASLEPERKVELLIKLAFGIPIDDLAVEYDLTRQKITNLRKNNYRVYNQFASYWKISKEVAILGLIPKYERAVNVIKKFYKEKAIIDEANEMIIVKGKKIAFTNSLDLADDILQKDGITTFKSLPLFIKNFYEE